MSSFEIATRHTRRRRIRGGRKGRRRANASQDHQYASEQEAVEQTSQLLDLPSEIMDRITTHLNQRSIIVYFLNKDCQQPHLVIKGPNRSLRLVCRKMNKYICGYRAGVGWCLDISFVLHNHIDLADILGRPKLAKKLHKITYLKLRGVSEHAEAQTNTFLDQWRVVAASLPKLKEIDLQFEGDRWISSDDFYDDCWFAMRACWTNNGEEDIALFEGGSIIGSMDELTLTGDNESTNDDRSNSWPDIVGNCRARFVSGELDIDYRQRYGESMAIRSLPYILRDKGNPNCAVHVKYNTTLVQLDRGHRRSMQEYDWVEFSVTTNGLKAIDRYLGPWHEQYCTHVKARSKNECAYTVEMIQVEQVNEW